MPSLFYYLVIAIAISISLFFIFFKKFSSKTKLIFKILSLSLALVFFFRYMWADDAIEEMFRLTNTSINGKIFNFISLIIVWLTYSSNLILILYAFFKVKLLNKFVYFLALPISIINLFLLPLHCQAIVGANVLNNFSFRALLLSVEIGITVAYSIAILIKTVNFKTLFKKDKKQKKAKHKNAKFSFRILCLHVWAFIKRSWVPLFCCLVILLSTLPPYALQGLLGKHYQLKSCLDFEQPHRIILYIGILLPFIIHYSLKKQSFYEKKFYLLFICLGTLISFSANRRFDAFADPTSWPLHLCNTAMYIMPIVLIFNMKKFFYFTYFINVAGAALAMLMPNYDSALDMYSKSVLIFYINHYIAFFMPILFVSLKMFERPKLKQFIYSMLGFLGYFALVLFLNALFTGMYEAGLASSATDFFFLNDDFVASKLGATSTLDFELHLKIGKITLTFYPLYQILFFFGYVLIGIAMWFLFAQAYEISDSFEDIRHRKEKIRLEELALNLKGENMKKPVTPENKDKLVLINFSKKYGNSSHFAVKDANLEVKAGEVFGFLGPNGAGKSTIIKSVVGIQPITSGRIEVCGYDMGTQPIECKMNLGFVPDHYALYEKLTGREYINYIADLYNVSKADRDERINGMVERFELAHSFDNQIKTYSHGMKQKIAIMAALVHNPKIWILDEPLTGLDPNSIFQVKECMKEHVKKGNIVFFSSHIIDVVEKICDRIAIIKKGEIQCVKTLKEIEDSGLTLEKFYMDTINK